MISRPALIVVLAVALLGPLARTARAEDTGEAEPPTPKELLFRLLVPAAGATIAFGSGAHPAALIALPYQYPLDDLLLPRFRVTLEPQVVIPPTDTIAFRLRIGLRWVPFLQGLMDEKPRFFVGAAASVSNRSALSTEIGWRYPFQWPLWTFFVALRGDWRPTGTNHWEAGLLTGFTLF